MRVGLVGLGRIGAFHAATLAAHPDVGELVLADADEVRAKEVAGRVGAATGDPFTADALVVATPTATHAALILRACAAGLPVFCEKPVAPDLAETERVAAEAGRAGVLVHIGFQRRFDAGYAAARRALRGGELGDLHRVHMLTADPRPPAAEYIPRSGGIFRDCHIHDFDALRWVTGREVESVFAIGANRGAEFFAAAGDVDNSAALLTLDDGTLVTMQGSRYNGAGYDVRMELAGTRRTLVAGLDDRVPLASAEPGAGYPPGEPWPDFGARFEAAYVAEMDAFLRAVRDGGPSPCPVDDALAALRVAEAAEASRRAGRPVRVAEVTA
ncbi:dehydrogenase [Sphaerisporangium rufum]|uniref:Dehydrogenase n=1 Tax=Sphaerisporangium rufum TaxID=1381558 RepID=A0A919UZI0_9ACTN|nr:Gfo/Idh/MocA family oxidoreductase [Sphaerisporangium rufum]GII77774.1 dehydrogenase [Sphaerisporangium rufum]